jgi:hypothetical protein
VRYFGRNAFASITLALVLTGCGDGNVVKTNNASSPDAGYIGDVADVGAPNPDLKAFAYESAGALCEKMFDCCSETERTEELGVTATDVADCTEKTGYFSMLFGYGEIDTSLKNGRVSIDASMADLCVEAIGETSCSEVNSSLKLESLAPGCREVISAQVNAGGDCDFDFECKTGYCQHGDAGATCETLPQENDSCEDSLRCDDGLYCDGLSFTCEAQAANGAACSDDDTCQSGFCDTEANGNKICAEPSPTCQSG